MRPTHFALHARPATARPGPLVALDGGDYCSLRVEPGQAELLGCTFDAAVAELATWPGLFCEPDGAFVWVSEHRAEPRWQLDGQLFDGGAGLLYVELRGNCPRSEFDRLLNQFGWPRLPLMFQLIREGVLLDEAEFRRFAESS